jgi:3-oxoacyl-[acyl-carrier protein] reductase
VPLGRLSVPEDQSAAVLWLASDQSSFITGHTIDVNGGVVML